jgi:hypothetical protein
MLITPFNTLKQIFKANKNAIVTDLNKKFQRDVHGSQINIRKSKR